MSRPALLAALLGLTLILPARADDPPRPPEPAQPERDAKPAEQLEGVVTADPRHREPWAWSADRPELLYRDRSWTHIGDNNFSQQSDGASDLTRKSAGIILRIVVPLPDAAMAEVGQARWKTVRLRGSIIGNDAGRVGETGATVVRLTHPTKGPVVGKIVKSGGIDLRFDKALLAKARRRDGAIHVFVVSGRNGATDVDDQELGRFQLVLSPDPMPAKPAPRDGEKPEGTSAPPRGK